jgi:hypothetical protein
VFPFSSISKPDGAPSPEGPQFTFIARAGRGAATVGCPRARRPNLSRTSAAATVMASDPFFARARELYLAHDGSRFYMSRNGVEHEYLSYGVPLEVE